MGSFSTLIFFSGANFNKYRQFFNGTLENAFVVPANTFDNITGDFLIGFFIWNLSKDRIEKNIKLKFFTSENKFIEDNIHDDYLRFFSHTINGWDSNNLNDMVVENVLIPPKELGIITIPSRYEFIQMKAKVLGISNGKTINYDGEEITEEVTKENYEYKWNGTNEEHAYDYRVTNNKKI